MFHAANQILHNEQDAVHQAFLRVAQPIQIIDQPISSVAITENKAIGLFVPEK